MNLQLFATLKNYNFKNLPRDIFSGIIIAAVSILNNARRRVSFESSSHLMLA